MRGQHERGDELVRELAVAGHSSKPVRGGGVIAVRVAAQRPKGSRTSDRREVEPARRLSSPSHSKRQQDSDH